MADPRCPEPFVPEQVLGRGASAVVWSARHDVTQQQVALKVWRRPLTDPDTRTRFVAEVRLLARLADEPHVVDVVWSSAPEDPLPWLALRPAGQNLCAWLLAHPDASAQVRLDVADGLLAGLGALHRRGLLHRDVAPKNVLVDENGRVRLCDFGLAVEIGACTVDPAAGTPGHVAPELDDGAAPTLASDVYSAASTIATLLGSTMSPAVEHVVVTRGLSQRPDDRPRDAEDFRRELARARAADDASAVPADSPHAVSRPSPSRERRLGVRHALVAVGVLFATLVSGIGLTSLLGRTSDRDVAAVSSGGAPLVDAASPDGSGAAAGAPTGPPVPFPGAAAFRVGQSHPAVLELDRALVRLGCTRFNDGDGYQPSERFTEYTRQNVRAFQLANPELDGQPDGYPGPLTWSLLFSARSIGCS